MKKKKKHLPKNVIILSEPPVINIRLLPSDDETVKSKKEKGIRMANKRLYYELTGLTNKK